MRRADRLFQIVQTIRGRRLTTRRIWLSGWKCLNALCTATLRICKRMVYR
jgi:hypothetical protein